MPSPAQISPFLLTSLVALLGACTPEPAPGDTNSASETDASQTGETAESGETVIARDESCDGLCLQRRERGITGSDIRRIGNNDVEILRTDRLRPVARNTDDVAEIVLSGILTRHRERLATRVYGRYRAAGPFAGYCHRDCAAACAEIEDLPVCAPRYVAQSELNQQFGLGARYQRGRADHEVERPEFLAAGYISERFAGQALCNRCFESFPGGLVQ